MNTLLQFSTKHYLLMLVSVTLVLTYLMKEYVSVPQLSTMPMVSEVLRIRALYLSTSSKPVFIPTREFLLKTGYRVEATLFNFYDENEQRMTFTKRFM